MSDIPGLRSLSPARPKDDGDVILVLTWGGTATILLLSLASTRILKKRFPGDYPFRNGPIARRLGAD